MKLNQKTIQVIKNFASINNSLQFNKGNQLRTWSREETIMARAKLDQRFEQSFCIYDLSKFLSVLSLFKEPVIEFTDDHLEIIHQNHRVFYTYCDPNMIKEVPNKELKAFEPYVQFTLPPETFSAIIKAINVLKLPQFAVVGDGNRLTIQGFDTANPVCDSYMLDIGETDKTFKAVTKIENLKFLSYNYSVAVNSAGMMHFKSDDVEYWVVLEHKASNFQ
jgi:gp45 sliding clamp, C terminal